ncbi:hypothetical protein ACFP3Q_02320 [Nocardioides sp. GCM10027113]|uniref:hypothetical protein n=1 Tax=unclassified Nocardioides TaxID=2615069 RepID=UPI00360F5F6F
MSRPARLTTRVVAAAATLAVSATLLPGPAARAGAERPRWDTRVFAKVPEPGFPAYVHKHSNGRVYAGTYTDPQGDRQRSRVFEWTGGGTLLRSWTVPGQDLDSDRGVQVANQDARGRLVLLEKSRSRVMTLDTRTGRFRTWATLPDLPTCSSGEQPCSPNVADNPAIPNYATWGPGGALFVSDYGQAVIWKISRRTQRPRLWFASPRLDGSEFGTTGIVFRPGRSDLLISQMSSTTDGSAPTNGKLFRLAVRTNGRPGKLSTLWESLPGELPDGFGIARSGRIYLATVGTTQQIVVLTRNGRELERFPEEPGAGDNGSSIPFDTPSNATFHGTRVLVANQAFTGNSEHHAILDVEVGERGRRSHLPRRAFWR